MTLFLTYVLLTLALSIFLTGISRFLQGYLYNLPASYLPLRGFAAGIVVASFLTFWVKLNVQAESRDRYGTLFEFNPTESRKFDKFEATRLARDGSETKVSVMRAGTRFVEVDRPHVRFVLTTSDSMVSAIEIPLEEARVRFEAELFVPDESNPGALRRSRPGDPPDQMKYTPQSSMRVFREVGGPRFIEFSQAGEPSPMYEPSRAALWCALGLNLGHFLVWLIAFWPILRFGLGTALGLSSVTFLIVMLLGMPLLFDLNTKKVMIPVAGRINAVPAADRGENADRG